VRPEPLELLELFELEEAAPLLLSAVGGAIDGLAGALIGLPSVETETAGEMDGPPGQVPELLEFAFADPSLVFAVEASPGTLDPPTLSPTLILVPLRFSTHYLFVSHESQLCRSSPDRTEMYWKCGTSMEILSYPQAVLAILSSLMTRWPAGDDDGRPSPNDGKYPQ
jgi:hypothetical protein